MNLTVINLNVHALDKNIREMDSRKILQIAENHQSMGNNCSKRNGSKKDILFLSIHLAADNAPGLLEKMRDPDSETFLSISVKRINSETIPDSFTSGTYLKLSENEETSFSSDLEHFLKNGDPVSPLIIRSIMENIKSPYSLMNTGQLNLTRVQHNIMNLLIEGWTDEEIAKGRSKSIYTIKNIVKIILKKLNARNRTHAAANFVRRYYSIILFLLIDTDLFEIAEIGFVLVLLS